MASELVKILSECEDNSGAVNHVLEQHPYAREIHDGKFNPSTYTIEELYQALETASYLAANAKDILDELLWKIGHSIELFYKTFVTKEIDYYSAHPYHGVYRYSPSPDANPFFKKELLLYCGKPPYMGAQLHFIMTDASSAALAGNVRLLAELLPYIGNRKEVLLAALFDDHAECLELLHPAKSEITMTEIARRDSVKCLQYMVSLYPDIVETDVTFADAGFGAPKCLDYIYEHKLVEVKPRLPHFPECIAIMVKYGFKITQEHIFQQMHTKRLTAFQELIRLKDFPITDTNILISACGRSSEAYIKLVLPDFKEPPPAEVTEKMWAEVYDVGVLSYLLDNGYTLTSSAMVRFTGFSDVFHEAIKHVPQKELNPQHCQIAASKRELNQLIAFRSRGCPWDEQTPIEAAREGSFECLRYAIINGCPYDINTLREVVQPQSQAAQYLNIIYPK